MIENNLKKLEEDWNAIPQNITKAFKDHDYDLFLEEYKNFKPKDNSIYFFKGVVLKEKGQYREALNYLNKFIEDYPHFYFVYKHKGECYIYLEEYELAREAYKEAASYDSKDAEIWCFTAICFYLEDKKDVAIALLDYALNEVKNKSLVSLLKGMMYEKDGIDDEALMNYVASQFNSTKDEERDTAGEKIFGVINKNH